MNITDFSAAHIEQGAAIAKDRYLHVTGAFCLREHCGKGVYQTLLSLAIRTLKARAAPALA